MNTRGELEAVYTNSHLTDTGKLRRKEEIIASLRLKYGVAKKAWGGAADYDDWFAKPINNAKLNTISEYYELGPAFQALLRAQGGDMEKFYIAVAALAKLPLEQRHAALRHYLKGC
jgi:predicted aminopeptidase